MKVNRSYILGFEDIDPTMLNLVGGKGASLGALSGIAGVNVPKGFCLTTNAFKEVISNNKTVASLVDQLAGLKTGNRKALSAHCEKIRELITQIPIPENIVQEIVLHLELLGTAGAYAIRSSATAEDLPAASFAGQQDTYLNIVGKKAILAHISKCWASLYTERAVVYRQQNGFDHRGVYLSVVMQKMIFPEAAGILFTANPLTGNRKEVCIDAGFGLGEALVAGIVQADHYKVRAGRILEKHIAAKELAVQASPAGGTIKQPVKPGQQNTPSLTDEQVITLERLGRQLEAFFGYPQDIEWGRVQDTFYIVQSRPITTLFPIPEAKDEENHVYVSVGHNQMMTDAMKPLGLSFFLLLTPAPMRIAGGRLFVDVTPMLASPSGRIKVIETFGKSDPLIRSALATLVHRDNFISTIPDEQPPVGENKKGGTPAAPDPCLAAEKAMVEAQVAEGQLALEALKQRIQRESGPALFQLIREDILAFKKVLFDPQQMRVIMKAIDASTWLNDKMEEWLGEKRVADMLSQSVPNNITSEMGLALLEVADAIRPFPAVMEYLQQAGDEGLEGLANLEGGYQARQAIDGFLHKYGMRCVGEIDITRTRWSEDPSILVPLILSNSRNFAPKAGKQKFEQGRQQALQKEQDLLERLKQLPEGEQKARETKEKINILRTFIGYREYPKYEIVNRYFVYKQALLKEAVQLLKAGIIEHTEDIYYLSFEELLEVVSTQQLDYQVIHQRKALFRLQEKLTPPRVITSDGEMIAGTYNREGIPAGAIVGLAVAAGVIEGRARVIGNLEEADLEEGDILVTAFTDPSWTPVFVSIKGLVTEVGGMMTHGAVIAREYGIPAVVGVEQATRLIRDGQRIRINGTEGYIEIL